MYCMPSCRSCSILQVSEHDQSAIGFAKRLLPPERVLSSTETPILRAVAKEQANPESVIIALGSTIATADSRGGSPLHDVKARIAWGVGGAFHEARVDFLNGTMLSLAASTIDITAIYTVGNGYVPLGPEYIASVSLGYGVRPTNGCVPSVSHTTIIREPFDPLEPPTVDLVPWATGVQILSSGTVRDPILAEMQDFHGRTLFQMNVEPGGVVPVVNGARRLVLTLPSNATGSYTAVTFRQLLAL